MARKLRFVVVGLGMGIHHCRAMLNTKNAELAGVCDHDPERLQEAVREFDVKPYPRWRDVLRDSTIDAVSIVTESGTHADFGIEAANAGKHILMEKPVDVTPQRISKLERAAARTGIKCGCIFQARMDPCNAQLRKAVLAGKMGTVIGVHAQLPWLRLDSYFAGVHGVWRGTWRWDGGGSLMNQGIHTLDLMCWFAGPVQSVAGFYKVHNHAIEAEDQTVAILQFERGALGTLFTTTCAVPERAQRIYMFGTKGSFIRNAQLLESYEMGTSSERARMMARFGGKAKADSTAKDPMALSADGHTLLIEDLVRAIRTGTEPAIPLSSARHAVDVAVAVYKSGKIGRAIAVGEVLKRR
ncbi:MAG: Gfo/Idh/MocA family oxidoreductase [Candidatus Hydrogenedentes bacterium]|nr:Gfo/Idh/MocA family oxidoreductase [Candidatus Hydrogenedentota bacterium]